MKSIEVKEVLKVNNFEVFRVFRKIIDLQYLVLVRQYGKTSSHAIWSEVQANRRMVDERDRFDRIRKFLHDN